MLFRALALLYNALPVRWQRVELVYAYRPVGGIEHLSSELIELRAFEPTDLPEVRADQRGIIERRAAQAAEWAKSRG